MGENVLSLQKKDIIKHFQLPLLSPEELFFQMSTTHPAEKKFLVNSKK